MKSTQVFRLPRAGHGGDLKQMALMAGKKESEILDFSANLNPLGPPEWLRSLLSSKVSDLTHYPDPNCTALIEAIAERYKVKTEEIIPGNGSTEILFLLPQILKRSRALIPIPSYSDYARAARLGGMKIGTIRLEAESGFTLEPRRLSSQIKGEELAFIGRPNNPDGGALEAEEIRKLAGQHPQALFIVDEAFGDFVEDFESLAQNRPSNVVVLLSMTKTFAIPGLRLGCAIADPGIIGKIREFQPSWSVNSLAQAVGARAMLDTEYLRQTRIYVAQQRRSLARELEEIRGLRVFEGRANFLLVRMERPGTDARTLALQLLKEGLALRVCDNFESLDARYFRVAVRTEEENRLLCDALSRNLNGGRTPYLSRKIKKPALMFQGASSNAGKSILATAFCRILLQEGYRVAPFKSQNMSLNSGVTRDGREMGRAQVVQAQACRLEPDARMNPILLKPNSDTGCQVILEGEPVGNMNVQEYIRFKPEAFAAAKKAYDQLASENEVMVLEGAGSPAEVNLKQHDIVNMQMARHAAAPVLVVGDIDRGGVFASFIGTLEVLAEWERAFVAGFVVNRFRGDPSLLKEALEFTRQHTGRPVLGVVPYLEKLGLPEEDSVTFKDHRLKADGLKTEGKKNGNGKKVDIAVVDLPHISNFTDFDALKIEPDVQVRVVASAEHLGHPDVIILPGSKSVAADLSSLREKGFEQAIHRLAETKGTEIVGICGGYQMLGEKITDPEGVESHRDGIRGMGLLPVATTMAKEKKLTRASGFHRPSGLKVTGYEIHHGRTRAEGLDDLVLCNDGEGIGAGRDLVWGTYLHGIFDADEFRRWFVDNIRVRRGWEPIGKISAVYDLEPAFDRLAEVVRASLDIPKILKLMGLK